MKRNRLTVLCSCVAILTLELAGDVSSQSDGSGNVKTAIVPGACT
jgi:hypothetical protein